MGGEGDDGAAPVGLVAMALDQAGVFEAVEDRHEVRSVDAEQLNEGLLWGGPAFAKVLKRVQLAGAQAQRLACLLDPPAHPTEYANP